MDQKGCPSENVQFKLRESVQIAAVLCKCCLEDWLFYFLLDHVIPILQFFSCPHSECQAPDGAGRTADVKEKMKSYSERIDSKRSFPVFSDFSLKAVKNFPWTSVRTRQDLT